MDPSPNPPNPPPAEGRNWAELSTDALSVIFGMIGAVDILMAAGRVCRAWRRVAREPLLWRRVDLTRLDHLDGAEMEAMARLAVDWSAGRMEEFSAAFFGSDELLLYVAERANLLKSLRLISCYDISDEGLTEMVKRFHCLEKLEIIFGSFTMKLCESIGQACPQLKLFKLNTKGSHYISDDEEELDNTDDCDALGIAKTMHELRQLQLFGNKVTNEGLKAILNSCPHLESLDVRRCFNLNMDASMKAMCSRIRNLRLPEDSADDYAYDAAVGSFDEDDDDDIFSEASEFDDMMYDNDYDYDYIDYDYQYGFGEDDDHPNLFFLL